MAGARTQWSGGITGLVVLAFLPFAGILDPLPQAILGAIVVGAVLGLLNIGELVGLVNKSRTDAALAWLTWAATLALAPNVQWAVIVGLVATIGAQMVRPVRLRPLATDDSAVDHRVAVDGLLWLGSHRRFEQQLADLVDERPGATIAVDIGPGSVSDPRLDTVLGRLHERAASRQGSVILSTSDRSFAGENDHF